MENKVVKVSRLVHNLHYIIFFTILILGTIFFYPRRENAHIVGYEAPVRGNIPEDVNLDIYLDKESLSNSAYQFYNVGLFEASEVVYLSPIFDNSEKDKKVFGKLVAPEISKYAIIIKPYLTNYNTRSGISEVRVFLDNDDSERFAFNIWAYFIFIPSVLFSLVTYFIKKRIKHTNTE